MNPYIPPPSNSFDMIDSHLAIRKQKKKEFMKREIERISRQTIKEVGINEEEFLNLEPLNSILQRIEHRPPLDQEEQRRVLTQVLMNLYDCGPGLVFESEVILDLILNSFLLKKQTLMVILRLIQLAHFSTIADDLSSEKQCLCSSNLFLNLKMNAQWQMQECYQNQILNSLSNLVSRFPEQIQANLSHRLIDRLLQWFKDSQNERLSQGVLIFHLSILKDQVLKIPKYVSEKLINAFLELPLKESSFTLFADAIKEIKQPSLGQLMKAAVQRISEGILEITNMYCRGKAFQALLQISKFHQLSQEVLNQQIYLEDPEILQVYEYTQCIKECLRRTAALKLQLPFQLFYSYLLFSESFMNKRILIEILLILIQRTKRKSERTRFSLTLIPTLFEFMIQRNHPLFEISLFALHQLLADNFQEEEEIRDLQEILTNSQITLLEDIAFESKNEEHKARASFILDTIQRQESGRREADQLDEMEELANELLEMMESAESRIIL